MRTILKLRVVLGMFLLMPGPYSYTQVSINNDNSLPDSSAMLDVKSTNKGFLPPRVALSSVNSANPIPSPAVGLVIFNTANSGNPPNNVTIGYYYWNGARWISLTQIQSDWNETNSGLLDFIKNKPTIPDTSNLASKDSLKYYYDKAQFYEGREFLSHFFTKILTTPSVMTVVFSGNSTTSGAYIVDTADNKINNVVKNLIKYDIPGIQVTNRGHSGKFTPNWDTLYMPQDTLLHPDLYIVRWGINDYFSQNNLHDRVVQYITALRDGLAKLRARYSIQKMSILLMSPNNVEDSIPGRVAYHDTIEGLTRQAARDYQCAYIDIHHMFYTTTGQPTVWIESTRIHPVDAYNRLIGSVIYDFIMPIGLRYSLNNVIDSIPFMYYNNNTIQRLGGYVGIGTNNPCSKFQVANYLTFDDVKGGVYIGWIAGNYGTSTGSYNTTLGFGSLASNTTGTTNNAFGIYSLTHNTTGNYNSAFGDNSLFSNLSGSSNTSVGTNTLYTNYSGSQNVGFGASSLVNNYDGSYNTAIGMNSLRDNVSGYQNVAIGNRAGYNGTMPLTFSVNNTFIGYGANASKDSIINSAAIGYSAEVIKSNQVVIGNSDVTETDLRGIKVMNTPPTITNATKVLVLNTDSTLAQQTFPTGTDTTWTDNGYLNKKQTSKRDTVSMNTAEVMNIILTASDTSVAVIGKSVFISADSSFYDCRSTISAHKWWKRKY
jgi:lysophospholipase L1-like esterase